MEIKSIRIDWEICCESKCGSLSFFNFTWKSSVSLECFFVRNNFSLWDFRLLKSLLENQKIASKISKWFSVFWFPFWNCNNLSYFSGSWLQKGSFVQNKVPLYACTFTWFRVFLWASFLVVSKHSSFRFDSSRQCIHREGCGMGSVG